VTIRISGFFRDAFPHLIALLDDAVKRVALCDEPPEQNFVRKHYLADLAAGIAEGLPDADRRARYRIFGSKPGAYGAGILPLIDERNWHDDADFAESYVNWGGYAYGADGQGVAAHDVFRHRLSGVQVALHNQDNREHDIFDSDDYFQFHGGMIATIRALTGRQPRQYFGDTHDPARPAVRDLKQEALRVFRTRVANPKWLESITRHGYKGGLEMAATVDYLFGYDATAGVAEDWMYAQVAAAYALDPTMQEFFARSNPWALHAIAERLLEAAQRELWEQPSPETLAALRDTLLHGEALLEARSESLS
jgi:cobaltochelatase CobN